MSLPQPGGLAALEKVLPSKATAAIFSWASVTAATGTSKQRPLHSQIR